MQRNQTCRARGTPGTSSLHFQELFGVGNRNEFERRFVVFFFIPAEFRCYLRLLSSTPFLPRLPSSLCVCKYEGRVCLLLLLSGFAASDIISRKAVFWGRAQPRFECVDKSFSKVKKKEEKFKSGLIERRGPPCTCCSSDFQDLCIQIVFNYSGRFYMKIYHWSRKMPHMHY